MVDRIIGEGIRKKLASTFEDRYSKPSTFLLVVIKRIKNEPHEEIFSEIYNSNLWGSNESRSGGGSTLNYTREIREQIERITRHYGIQVMLDAPCGDFNWMKEVPLKIERYYGADIVPELIARNNDRFRNDKREFILLDLIKGPVPRVDLILCRQLIQHLELKDARSVLSNLVASGSTYLLTTTFPGTERNVTTFTGGFSPYNLCKSPFNLPEPIELFEDGNALTKPYLGLWKLTI